MDSGAFLVGLLAGQLALVILDLRERSADRRRGADRARLRPGSVLFLGATIVVYGGIQFGGLALVPNAAEILLVARSVSIELLGPGDDITWPTAVLAAAVGVLGFYFAGLCDYLFHRFVSHSRPFWFSHENHHLTTDVSAFMPGLCVRPFAVIIVFPTSAVAIFAVQLLLGTLGFNAWNMMPVLYAVVLAQATVLGITHSAFMRRCQWPQTALRPLGITSPQEHWLHHTSDLECNYGNFTILWDRVFGTYLDPQAVEFGEHRAGLDYDQDFLGTITLNRFRLSAVLRERFQLAEFCYLEPAEAGTGFRDSGIAYRDNA